jgi:hypothetical protein
VLGRAWNRCPPNPIERAFGKAHRRARSKGRRPTRTHSQTPRRMAVTGDLRPPYEARVGDSPEPHMPNFGEPPTPEVRGTPPERSCEDRNCPK